MLASVATNPAAAFSFIPNDSPSFVSGLFKTLVKNNTNGNAPANVIAILPTISIPSVIGAIPGITTIPVNVSIIDAANPIVITITTPFPKIVNPLVIFSGIFQRPKDINAEKIIIGSIFESTNSNENPAVNPPAKQPIGIVIIPANIPFAKYGLSSFSIIPSATGIVNTRVGPIIAPSISPANFPASGESASSIASGYPPISFANNVVANIAGSAPSIV